MTAIPQPLRDLCALCGVRTEYHSIDGQLHVADPDVLLHVLRCLGVDVADIDAVPAAADRWRLQRCQRLVEPVIVCWQGDPLTVTLTLPEEAASHPVELRLTHEDGTDHHTTTVDPQWFEVRETLDVAGQQFRVIDVDVPDLPAPGYYDLHLTAGDGDAVHREMTARIIHAPRATWTPDTGSAPRHQWGVFAPLYALRSSASQGVGDVSDLDRLRQQVSELGGDVVATLPMMAAFLGHGLFEPSPYTPASRLFWNEIYIDLHALPDLADAPRAREIMASAEWQAELQRLAAEDHVDHAAVMALKRRVLEAVVESIFGNSDSGGRPDRRAELEAAFDAWPGLLDYARFRATCERRGESWHCWPETKRNGELGADEYDPAVARYHCYVQHVAGQQIGRLAARSRADQTVLYIDQPLGIHPDSFDLWRWRDCYLPGLSAGAPPDPLATAGQDWGIPPLHPWRNRQRGYDYVIRALRHLMRISGILRIDHVMQMHRIFVIPHGHSGEDGVYLTYPHEELWALVCLESHRHQCAIVGEDLGTVPDEVREQMATRGVLGMAVMQFMIRNDETHAVEDVPPTRVASVNTHDTPTWAGFWHGRDIEDRVVLGWQTEDGAAHEKQQRDWSLGALAEYFRRCGHMEGDATPGLVLRAALEWMASGETPLTLVTLEDLWLEERPQNVPGTWRERPNWQRRCARSLDELATMDDALDTLRAVNRLRRRTS